MTGQSGTELEPTAAPALKVDDDEVFLHYDLPMIFLSTEPDAMRQAAKKFEELQMQAYEVHGELELIERALRFAELQAEYAGVARPAVRQALAGLENGTLDAMDRAADAFNRANRQAALQAL